MNRHAPRDAWLEPRCGTGNVPLACCEPTTYVRDRAHVERPGGRHRCSNEPRIGKRHALLRNSQDGHRKEQKKFCCVTTRPDPDHHPARDHRPAWTPTPTESRGGPPPGEHVADARRSHVLREPPAAGDVLLVAWRPASDVQAAGISGLGSTAGSNAGPCKCGHTLCAGRCAGTDADRWPKGTSREYVGDVPREVFAPAGAARETRESRSGIFNDSHLRQPARASRSS